MGFTQTAYLSRANENLELSRVSAGVAGAAQQVFEDPSIRISMSAIETGRGGIHATVYFDRETKDLAPAFDDEASGKGVTKVNDNDISTYVRDRVAALTEQHVEVHVARAAPL